MDIVITIPKSEYKNYDNEIKDVLLKGHDMFWTLARIPKRLSADNRVYFVKDGEIGSSMKVIEINRDTSSTCETTGRTWSGKCQIVMNDYRKEAIQNVKGFQGFRYKWW